MRGSNRSAASVTSALILALGIVLVVSTVVRGGGPLALGVVVGALFCVLGGGRLYLEARR